MKSKPTTQELLDELIAKRAENVIMLKNWPSEELLDMIEKYHSAKELALTQKKDSSVKLLNEKIAQMSAALESKSPEQTL